MSLFRRLSAAALSLALAGSIVVAVPSAATAAPAESAAAPTDVWDRVHNLWSYRLSMMPPSLEELIRLNPNIPSDQLADNWMKQVDDFAYQRQEASIANNARVNRLAAAPDGWTLQNGTQHLKDQAKLQTKKFKFPITKPGQLIKGAGVAGVAMLAGNLITTLGDGAIRSWGVDVEGQVCDNAGTPILELVWSGVDCEAWRAAKEFVPNLDAMPRPPGYIRQTMITGYEPSGNHYFACRGGPIAETDPDFTCEITIGDKPQGVSGAMSAFCRTSTGVVNKVAMTADPASYAANSYTPIQFTGSCPGGATLMAVSAGAAANPTNVMSGEVITTGTTILWYSKASPHWTPGEEADPERQLECEIAASDGAVYRALSDKFRETGSIADPVCPTLPPGTYPLNQVINTVKENGTKTKLMDEPSTPEFKEFLQQNPECMSGLCTLDLYSKVADESCFTLDLKCNGWFEDPQKDAKYQCEYNAKKVELARCNAYRQVFDPEFRAKGFAYSNPVTGQVQLTPTAPNIVKEAGKADADWDSCMETAVSEGVWATIFSPVRCALVWAFVPDSLKVKETTANLRDEMTYTPMGQLLTIVGSWNLAVALDGCQGPPLDLVIPSPFGGNFLDYHGYPVNACPGEMLHPFTEPVRVFFNVFLIIAGGLTVINMVSAVIGYRRLGSGGSDAE